MFPDRPPFHYKCKNCGHFFTTDEKLNAPSELSLISLDFDENTEIDENGNVKVTIKPDKKESTLKRLLKKILEPKCPKCPKCNEHAVVSVDYMLHK
ncbi:hypothetical protein [Brachyspira pulli]|uniref:hypothetical protein n=1 Tax=Brachyspira pulli TaxID=310721 RepID=UPI0030043B95